ncbi:MAG: carbohydrate kinase family protein [Candidatus Eisenbacteria bacterium]
MSRVAVVGTINHDRIVTAEGRTHEDLGGILYNVLTLAPFLGEKDALLPVARVGVEKRAEVERLLAPYSCIDRSHLIWWPGGTNETVLRYLTADVREETLIERIVPLGEEELQAAAACDLVVANLIWGKELDPGRMRALGARGALLLMDIQSLVLTFERGPGRGYRNIPEWREWAAPVRVLKGNEEEVRWFAGEKGPFAGEIREALGRLLDAGPEVAIATKGTSGSSIAWREEEGRFYAEIPGVPVPAEECVDSTGCGDAFSSGYALGVLKGERPLEAALLGSSLAALACRRRGLRALRDLPDPLALRGDAYAEVLLRIARGGGGDRLP